MTSWIVILAIGLGSYGLRATMLALVAKRPMPESFGLPMSFVGPAAIAALTGSLVFTSGGAIRTVPIPELVAVITGGLVVRRSGVALHAFGAGLPVFWALTALTR